MTRNTKLISFAIFLLISLLILSFFKYQLFYSEDSDIKMNKYLRLLEMSNVIFHPFLKNGDLIDYYNKQDSIVKGVTTYEKGKIVKRIRYYENGNIKLGIPIKYCSNHGIIKMYFDNKKLQYLLEYQLGKKNGKAIEYFKNGNTRKIFFYKNDSLTGEHIEYDSLGNIINEKRY